MTARLSQSYNFEVKNIFLRLSDRREKVATWLLTDENMSTR